MEFFRIQHDIPFMKHALVFNIISLVTFALAVVFLATRGLNLGVDFRGGTVIEIAYTHPADLNRVRGVLDKMNLGEFAVQSFGSASSAWSSSGRRWARSSTRTAPSPCYSFVSASSPISRCASSGGSQSRPSSP